MIPGGRIPKLRTHCCGSLHLRRVVAVFCFGLLWSKKLVLIIVFLLNFCLPV